MKILHSPNVYIKNHRQTQYWFKPSYIFTNLQFPSMLPCIFILGKFRFIFYPRF